MVQRPTEKPGAILTRVPVPDSAKDFLPETTSSADSLTVSVQPPCAMTCINICAHVKNPQHWQPSESGLNLNVGNAFYCFCMVVLSIFMQQRYFFFRLKLSVSVQNRVGSLCTNQERKKVARERGRHVHDVTDLAKMAAPTAAFLRLSAGSQF